METFTYEFELFKSNDGFWLAFPFGLKGGTQGYTKSEAINMAVDWLKTIVDDAREKRQKLPNPVFDSKLEHGGERLIVSVSL